MDESPETMIRNHRVALEIALEVVAEDLRIDAETRKVARQKLADFHEGMTQPERHLDCHEDPLWQATHFLEVPEDKRPETSLRLAPVYDAVIADFFDGVVDPGKLLVGEPMIVERRIGKYWLLTSPDVDGLYVANLDREVAMAAVPSAIEMLERVRARIAARREYEKRFARIPGCGVVIFDDPTLATSGWFAGYLESPRKFSDPAFLPKGRVWWTNLDETTATSLGPNFRPADHLGSGMTALLAERDVRSNDGGSHRCTVASGILQEDWVMPGMIS